MSNRKPFTILRHSSSMEIEPASEQNNNDNEINPMFAELQIKRDNRRTSERMHAHNISLSSNGARSEDPIGAIDDLSTQNSDAAFDRQASLQMLDTPENSSRSRPSQRGLGESLLSYFQNITNPFRRSTSSQTQQVQQQNSQLPPLILNPIENTEQNNQADVNLPQILNTETGSQTVPGLVENALDNFPHGALIVRTVTPGPDGTLHVRLRVIPMEDLLNSQNQEGSGAEGSDTAAIFGALMGMLSGNSVDRGLEKEVLDSLPVVTFNAEAFKNVEEESKKCAICFEDYEDGHDIKYLWCLHRFHKGCVDQWLGSHSTCPVCKKDYSEAKKECFE